MVERLRRVDVRAWSDRRLHCVAGSLRNRFWELTDGLTPAQEWLWDVVTDEMERRRRRGFSAAYCLGCDLCRGPFD